MNNKCLILKGSEKEVDFSLLNYNNGKKIVSGKCMGIGTFYGCIELHNDQKVVNHLINMYDKEEALIIILNALLKYQFISDVTEIKEVGNHLLYGGKEYSETTIVDDDVLRNIAIKSSKDFSLIYAAYKYLPDAIHMVSFDANFYCDGNKSYLPEKVLPLGFHGLSYQYLMYKMQMFLQEANFNIIMCHLGNTSSVCCVKNGKDKIASMIDPKICNYKRTVENAKNGSINALSMINNYQKNIATIIRNFYYDLHGKLDGIVFTGEYGANIPELRQEIINNIKDVMKVSLKEDVNAAIGEDYECSRGVISDCEENIPVLVFPVNDDLTILGEIHKKIEDSDFIQKSAQK